MMKIKYNKYTSRREKKLLFANKCIVEYECHELYNGKPYIKVKCSQEIFWAIPEDKELSFERINTSRRLSTIEKVRRAYLECPDLKTPIDRLLGIRTLGNKSFFTDHIVSVSPIGKNKIFH